MEYRSFRDTGIKTSLLGMGNMRLPTLPGRGMSGIDYEKGQEIIDYAYSHGINYYDTAYVYHGGQSEVFLGKALSKYPRESYYIADKLPGFQLTKYEEIDKMFNEQLKRLGVDYIDFYLCHNMNDGTYDKYVGLGVFDRLCELRDEGKIRYIGFSSHADPDMLEDFASKYKWDFAQIQLNYLDWEYQDAKRQYEILTNLGIPVMVMEPVRGGRLASLGAEADALLKSAKPEMSIASWGIRFAASLPNVQVVLSGMTELSQIVDNVATISNFEPVTDGEKKLLDHAVDTLMKGVTVPCTACRYCTDDCPAGLEIPDLLEIYNDYAIAKSPMELMGILQMPEEKRPDKCISCGSCASHCPQNIKIPDILSSLCEAVKNMPPPPG